MYGTKYDQSYLDTEWKIIAPFDEELKHGTRIIISTCPYAEPTAPIESVPTDRPVTASHMGAFRNAQGEFLPAMSDSDEYQYWRILKINPSKSHIKPGDEVRLAWDFRDQTTGWRDFKDDIFGRRQVTAPSGLTKPLLLKVPWPRFEVAGKPTALIMASEDDDVVYKSIQITRDNKPGSYVYGFQDVRMRIDAIGRNGHGDTSDYMLNSVSQEGKEKFFSFSVNGNPLAMRDAIFWFGIR